MSGITMGAARRQQRRGLALIEVRRTEAHTTIDSHTPPNSDRFRGSFSRYVVEYRLPRTMAEGVYRIFSLYYTEEEAKEAMQREYFKDGRIMRLKQLMTYGWNVICEIKTEARYANPEGGVKCDVK